jgi:hypothetical protein
MANRSCPRFHSTSCRTIPDIEGLAGAARHEAAFKKAYGVELYDRDAVAFFEASARFHSSTHTFRSHQSLDACALCQQL